MSDPLTGAGAVLGGGLLGSVLYGFFTHTDFGVVFGAFGGAVFYVATATNLSRARLAAYFLTSFIVGVLGAGLIGSLLNAASHYEKPLDALGAVILSALCIKILTYLNNQDLNNVFKFFSRLRGGGGNGN
ncbi:phage holin family protein [Enterobacter cloacae]|uniref:phage holin family protein n=1 Tax=Enterobacter cloacae TaxID=550 RepID=UPI0029DCFB0F|nr:phage holin family protein [Enterobacter cloacae]MDX7022001.1 phage holin family protein [Enterobacter cloacae]